MSHVHRYRRGALTLLVSTLSVLFATEGLLRLWPQMLGQRFATAVLTKYGTGSRGIYYYDPSVKMLFMKPGFVTENYWNGYRWHHETDALGFRNPRTRTQAAVLLLGDSLIYGHGVDIDSTVGLRLERRVPYSVVNMGTQAYCAYQEAYLAAEYVPKLRPRYVFYFFFENDIPELYLYLTDQEMREFIQRAVSDIRYRARTNPSQLIKSSPFDPVLRKLYVMRALDLLRHELRLERANDRQPPADRIHDVDDEDSLAWAYTKHAILFMNAVSKATHATLVVVPLTRGKKHYYDILHKFAGQHQLVFLEQSQIHNWPVTHFLPRDGHFSGTGADAMATLLAEFIRAFENR